MSKYKVGDYYHINLEEIQRYHSIRITAIGETKLLCRDISYKDITKPLEGHTIGGENPMGFDMMEEYFVLDPIMNATKIKKEDKIMKKYSYKFSSWFTSTCLCSVSHPEYGNHQVTASQIVRSSKEYQDSLYIVMERAYNNGHITTAIIKERG